MNHLGNIGPKIDVNLYQVDLNRKIILDEILSNKQIRVNQNPLHTSFEDSIFNPPPKSESRKFVDKIQEFFRGYSLMNIWSHIHEPLESTNTHQHGEEGLSFAYYIKVPEKSGTFVFDFSISGGPRFPITPVEGLMIVFPSWVPHMVTKNLSKEKRISISGNLVKQ